MTIQVAIQDRFAQMLAPLGDLHQTVDTALRRCAIEQITTKYLSENPIGRLSGRTYRCKCHPERVLHVGLNARLPQ